MSAHDLSAARRADSTRRRQRVSRALDELAAAGEVITPAAVARQAGVHRSFLYRPAHQDLLAKVQRAQAAPPTGERARARISDPGLRAENANLRAQNQRMAAQLRVLEGHLSEHLGTQVLREAGLASGETSAELLARAEEAEDQVRALRSQLRDVQDELEASRSANRELVRNINAPTP